MSPQVLVIYLHALPGMYTPVCSVFYKNRVIVWQKYKEHAPVHIEWPFAHPRAVYYGNAHPLLAYTESQPVFRAMWAA